MLSASSVGAVSTASVQPSTSTSTRSDQPKTATGPAPPKFDKSNFQSPTIAELRAIGIGLKKSPGKLELIVYCPMSGRCPHCNSMMISANSVGSRKLIYAIPWPKSLVGIDMRCGKCKKHWLTHDPKYVRTLPMSVQLQQTCISTKGNGTDLSLIRMLRSGVTVAQVERLVQEEVTQHYLHLKSEYITLWDKVTLCIMMMKMTMITSFLLILQ